MSNKVIITTVFSGFNYGSSLQALASKILLNELGYDCQLLAMKSIIKGRDVRFKKLVTIIIRSMLLRRKIGAKPLKTYRNSYRKTMIGDSASRFALFTREYLIPCYISWNDMKKVAKESIACFAGSDQIWNSSTMYVDPMYYLRFAPREKRIAFAPSFGRDFIADYNKKKMGKWISDFRYLSAREDSGIKLIKELTGRDAVQLVDPTLLVDGETWKKTLCVIDKQSNYILAYFLDNPSRSAIKAILDLKKFMNCEVIAIPYQFDDMSYCDKIIPAGPIEFVDLINNAKCVLTDSFHGTAFSINLHTPFFVFDREYGSAHSQNIRLQSILKKVDMLDRFDPKDVCVSITNINFDYSDKVLTKERNIAKKYIVNAINTIKLNEC